MEPSYSTVIKEDVQAELEETQPATEAAAPEAGLLERGNVPVGEEDTKSSCFRSRRLLLTAAAAAILGLALLLAGLAVLGRRRCSSEVMPLEWEARMVPSAGAKTGPLERALRDRLPAHKLTTLPSPSFLHSAARAAHDNHRESGADDAQIDSTQKLIEDMAKEHKASAMDPEMQARYVHRVLASQDDITAQEATVIVANAQAAGVQAAQAAAQAQAEIEQELADDVPDEHKQTMRAQAKCALTTTAVAESITKMGANLNSAIAVCKKGTKLDKLAKKSKKLNHLRTMVCAVNSQFVATGLVSIAGGLSAAASSCSRAVNRSSSLSPEARVDAQCAQATIGLVEGLNYVAMAAEITYLSCDWAVHGIPKKILFALKKAGMLSVDNFGDGGSSDRAHVDLPDGLPARRLLNARKSKEELKAKLKNMDADARRLFVGGGKDTNLVLCAVDAIQVANNLGVMGLTLDEAVNVNCPAKRVSGTLKEALSPGLRDTQYSISQASCGVDVSRILYNLGAVATYISMTNFHCTGKLNLQAICGAGTAGLGAALAGLALAGQATYLACDVGQDTSELQAKTATQIVQYLGQVATDSIQQQCPQLSFQCLLGFQAFLQGPPPSGCSKGVVSQLCPQVPPSQLCPGVEPCQAEYAAWRDSGGGLNTPWPINAAVTPTTWADFVSNTQSCWKYVDCFAPPTGGGRRLADLQMPRVMARSPETRLLMEDAVAQIVADFNDAERAEEIRSMVEEPKLASAPPKFTRSRGLPAEAGTELSDEMWKHIGKNLTAISEQLFPDEGEEDEIGDPEHTLRLLEQATELLALRREEADQCSS